VDIFDTCQCILQARTKTFMSSSGPIIGSSISDTKEFCDCVGCKEISKNNFEFENVLVHNIRSLYHELALVKTAISNGTLRGLVEQRMVTEPKLAALIRIMDLEQYERLEQYFPVFRSGQFLTSSRDALGRPEIIRFQNRIINRFKKPDDARVLVLLPCSAKKPYSTSKSHKLFKQAIQQATQSSGFGDTSCLHEMIVTSPLGIVPRELELVYPAQQYDIPVTGHWFEDELQMIKECLIKYLSSNHYDHIVIHLPGQLGEFVENVIKDTTPPQEVIRTCTNSATGKDSLNRLTKELKQLVEKCSNSGKTTRVSNKRNYQIILEGIAAYQFGPVGKKLVEDCNIKGKYPYLRLLKENIQVGMLTGERGLISLTLDGGRLLVDEPDFKYEVVIDDFVPKGSIMAIGILEANPAIRVGDDVVACHKKELRAVGQAVMCGIEMENSNRGQGIKVRHHV